MDLSVVNPDGPWFLRRERPEDRPRLMPGGSVDWRSDEERLAARRRLARLRSERAAWGKRLRAKREVVRLSQRALAVACGTQQSVVSAWELGLNGPSPALRARADAVLAEALFALWAIEDGIEALDGGDAA